MGIAFLRLFSEVRALYLVTLRLVRYRNSMSYLAKELSMEQRSAIESLLGRRVSEDEAVTVQAYRPASMSPQKRAEIVDGLKAYFGELDARKAAADAGEADAAFEEAMRQTRPNFQTHR